MDRPRRPHRGASLLLLFLLALTLPLAGRLPAQGQHTVALPLIAAPPVCVHYEVTPPEARGNDNPRLCLNRLRLRVGEELHISSSTWPTFFEPDHTLSVKEGAGGQFAAFVRVSSTNQVTSYPAASQLLELVSAEGGLNGAQLVLRARAAGTLELSMYVSGEVNRNGQIGPGYGVTEPISSTIESGQR